ncbi:hypothetical protein J437_LFUL014193 [Ladona fulva]|uniref:inositol-3-phosphate synthase n=1 Tax=Ladona fulva TaxID=123851 RepID=A0A8K0KH62_LADFU|nr:hypothetical protein J437_LFUL014193 [Ladona fulva]
MQYAYPETFDLKFKLQKEPKSIGVMMVGWGGNNGTTFTASLLANQGNITWEDPRGGTKAPNWLGSLTQCSTAYLGIGGDGKEVYIPWNGLVPLVDVNKIKVGGWDISKMNMADATARAHVLDIDLQRKLRPLMEPMVPLPSVYDPKFVASNQNDRANNVLKGSKSENLEKIIYDIVEFRKNENLDLVIVVWTANTERCCEIMPGIHDTAENLFKAIYEDHPEISPSTLFAIAAIKAQCPFINGSPQNTLVPGCIDFAEKNGIFVAGDDFKSGQTKLKSVLVDFLVGAGLKPMSIMSYNHLGNNDGKNLSAPEQFRSKEVKLLMKPYQSLYFIGLDLGDSKRAMDEYISEIMLGGHNTIVIHNVCEDSLLATPLILDLVVLTEFFGRLRIGSTSKTASHLHSALSILGYFLKAPVGMPGAPVVNALAKQRSALENLLRACVGLGPVNHMHLEHRVQIPEFASCVTSL